MQAPLDLRYLEPPLQVGAAVWQAPNRRGGRTQPGWKPEQGELPPPRDGPPESVMPIGPPESVAPTVPSESVVPTVPSGWESQWRGAAQPRPPHGGWRQDDGPPRAAKPQPERTGVKRWRSATAWTPAQLPPAATRNCRTPTAEQPADLVGCPYGWRSPAFGERRKKDSAPPRPQESGPQRAAVGRPPPCGERVAAEGPVQPQARFPGSGRARAEPNVPERKQRCRLPNCHDLLPAPREPAPRLPAPGRCQLAPNPKQRAPKQPPQAQRCSSNPWRPRVSAQAFRRDRGATRRSNHPGQVAERGSRRPLCWHSACEWQLAVFHPWRGPTRRGPRRWQPRRSDRPYKNGRPAFARAFAIGAADRRDEPCPASTRPARAALWPP